MAGFHVYITTSPNKTAYYVGMTNDLEYRIIEHYLNRGNAETFAGKYYCYNLVYYEYVDTALGAIEREKQIKRWGRSKKEKLIMSYNPDFVFLNEEVTPWPPDPEVSRRY